MAEKLLTIEVTKEVVVEDLLDDYVWLAFLLVYFLTIFFILVFIKYLAYHSQCDQSREMMYNPNRVYYPFQNEETNNAIDSDISFQFLDNSVEEGNYQFEQTPNEQLTTLETNYLHAKTESAKDVRSELAPHQIMLQSTFIHDGSSRFDFDFPLLNSYTSITPNIDFDKFFQRFLADIVGYREEYFLAIIECVLKYLQLQHVFTEQVSMEVQSKYSQQIEEPAISTISDVFLKSKRMTEICDDFICTLNEYVNDGDILKDIKNAKIHLSLQHTMCLKQLSSMVNQLPALCFAYCDSNVNNVLLVNQLFYSVKIKFMLTQKHVHLFASDLPLKCEILNCLHAYSKKVEKLFEHFIYLDRIMNAIDRINKENKEEISMFQIEKYKERTTLGMFTSCEKSLEETVSELVYSMRVLCLNQTEEFQSLIFAQMQKRDKKLHTYFTDLQELTTTLLNEFENELFTNILEASSYHHDKMALLKRNIGNEMDSFQFEYQRKCKEIRGKFEELATKVPKMFLFLTDIVIKQVSTQYRTSITYHQKNFNSTPCLTNKQINALIEGSKEALSIVAFDCVVALLKKVYNCFLLAPCAADSTFLSQLQTELGSHYESVLEEPFKCLHIIENFLENIEEKYEAFPFNEFLLGNKSIVDLVFSQPSTILNTDRLHESVNDLYKSYLNVYEIVKSFESTYNQEKRQHKKKKSYLSRKGDSAVEKSPLEELSNIYTRHLEMKTSKVSNECGHVKREASIIFEGRNKLQSDIEQCIAILQIHFNDCTSECCKLRYVCEKDHMVNRFVKNMKR